MKLSKTVLFVTLIICSEIILPQRKPVNTAKSDSIKTAEEAFKLINTPEPSFQKLNSKDYNYSQYNPLKFKQICKSVRQKFLMRDGKYLSAQKFPADSSLIIIMLHGVLSSSLEMNSISGSLSKTLNAEVYALDIRGHGESDGKPGDVDYINQYEDDLADVIKNIRKENPRAKIILAGHSMGGGIELRYAENKNYPYVDGYLLFAPLLGQNTPTFSKPAKVKDSLNSKKEPFMKIDIKRIIGLKIVQW
jgi:pimeloyl-ACP methyl ester carboxylesterase